MRFILILLLFAPLILSASDDDIFKNEIPVDETLMKERENVSTKYESVPDVLGNEEDQEVNDDHESGRLENLNLEEAYESSVQSYLDEDWEGCIDGFTEAIKRFKQYKNMVISCRRQCRKDATGFEPIFPESVEDLHYYEKKVRETLCLLKCNQDYRDVAGSQSLKRPSKNTEAKYKALIPYEYLHICYYQKNRFQDAANAVYTYLSMHTKHEMSQNNLRYYIGLSQVDESKLKNLEADPFLALYVNGVTAYNDNDYVTTMRKLENSLSAYLKSEEDCRLYCEGHFDQGWLPEFVPSVANHFVYCLKCKRGCSQRLNIINGEYHNDLLASHYHYLQFAYYKLGNDKSACAAVASYLLFYPADETMLDNKRYYSNLPKVNEDYFTPREEALNYVKRQEYEVQLLKLISEEFATIQTRLNDARDNADNNLQAKLTNHPPPGHSPAFRLRLLTNKTALSHDDDVKLVDENSTRAKKFVNAVKKIRIVADGDHLGGKLRYLADGLLNKSECESLVQLAELGAVKGDGYEGNASPHSTYELFEGLTPGRAALMVYFGSMKPEILDLALRSTEAARDHVEKYFNLDRHLYFTYTHLACRSPLPGSPMDRQDLSHTIHADNCLIEDDGTCIHEWPAYTFRDYSAIIYLNDDFEGGEFVFAGDSKAETIQGTIKPSCGRMVAFSASGENLHGVRGVLRGKRCALALWFTFDEEHLEIERLLARAIIERVRNDGPVTPGDYESVTAARYEDTLSNRFEKDEKLSQLFKTILELG